MSFTGDANREVLGPEHWKRRRKEEEEEEEDERRMKRNEVKEGGVGLLKGKKKGDELFFEGDVNRKKKTESQKRKNHVTTCEAMR